MCRHFPAQLLKQLIGTGPHPQTTGIRSQFSGRECQCRHFIGQELKTLPHKSQSERCFAAPGISSQNDTFLLIRQGGGMKQDMRTDLRQGMTQDKAVGQ
ncbi:MAG: hypothetical protein D3915_00200 [Candidatus Electrothrix sp. AU1_5]|nr:hypothetical protein [Candidatus Electrothrix gigas]